MMKSPNYGDFFMIYVKDNYTLENEQTVILLEAYPETLFTNTSDEEAVLEYSHNGTNWDTLLTLAPNQKQSIAVTSRYVRQITKTTVEATGVGSHITPLVLASNPLQSGTDFSDYITKPQLDSAIAKVNDKTALLATQEQLQTATQSQTRALNQLTTQVSDKANQSELTTEIEARSQAIEALKGTITTNKQTQDSTINQLRADLNTKANQSDLATETSNRTSAIAGLNQTAATHKQQLDRQIQSLEQSKADKNTVNQQLSTKANQSQIDGINTAMEQKASKLNQVTAGNGLTGGGTLANSFQIALGLPSTISRSTTNSVTSTSHTHAIETATTTRSGIVQLNDNLTSTSTEQALTARQGKSLKEQLDRLSNTVDTNNTGMSVMVNTKVDKITSITTGEGLTGGGTLSENLVIALGTPSTITQSSTNTTTANSHSHAIDTATTTQAGIVTLSHETNGTNKTKAVSEFALGEVRRLVNNLNSTITSQTPNLTTLAWNSITDKPTTLAGYGITDAISRNTDTEITSLLTINKSDSYIQGKSSNTRKWYIGKGSSFSDDIQLHNFTHSTQLNLTNNKIVASHDLYVNDSKVITASDTTVFVTPDALNQALIAKASINHQHTIAEVSELQSILNSKLDSNASAISAQKLTTPRRINGIVFDGTQDITLPTTTNVSWSAISNKPANFTPSAHSHVIADITNLQRELDSKASSNHSHAWNSITDKPTTLTGYGIGNAMQTDTDSETTGLISINRADSYIQGKQGSIRRWYVGSGSSSNHNVQLSNSTHNTQLELTNDRITSNKALYVGTRRVLLEGDETASTTAQPTNTAVRVTIHPVAVLTDNFASQDSTTFVYPDGRIVHSFIYKNLRQPVFNSITSGGTHVRTLTINLPTAMPRYITQVNAYFYRPEFTDASFPLIISHKANDISNSSINLQISGTAREIRFSGYLDLVVIVEGF